MCRINGANKCLTPGVSSDVWRKLSAAMADPNSHGQGLDVSEPAVRPEKVKRLMQNPCSNAWASFYHPFWHHVGIYRTVILRPSQVRVRDHAPPKEKHRLSVQQSAGGPSPITKGYQCLKDIAIWSNIWPMIGYMFHLKDCNQSIFTAFHRPWAWTCKYEHAMLEPVNITSSAKPVAGTYLESQG